MIGIQGAAVGMCGMAVYVREGWLCMCERGAGGGWGFAPM